MYDEDMDERSIEALQSSLAGVCGHVNAQHAQLVRLAEQALAGEAWKQIGIHSPSHWLAWQAGLATGTAQKVLAVAERAVLHPEVMVAFDRGELSLDQVALAMRAPGWADAEICGLAKVLTVAQVSMVVRKYPFPTDEKIARRAAANGDTVAEPAAPAPEPEPEQEPVSSMSMAVDGDGVGQMRARLSPDDCRVFETAMREARDALFLGGNPDVNWVDALVEICHRSLDSVSEGSRRDRFRINLYVNAVGLVGGVPVNVGRSQRIVPERTRRLVEHRTWAAGCLAVPRPVGCKCITSCTGKATTDPPRPGT